MQYGCWGHALILAHGLRLERYFDMRLIPVFVTLGLASMVALGGIVWLAQSDGDTWSSSRPAEVVLNTWEELVPADAFAWVPDIVTEDMLADPDFMAKVDASDRRTRPELNQQSFGLPGYMVPLDYDGTQVRRFLLVPNAGQCVHQPPPPVNQTILVEANPPVPMRDLFVPIQVTGTLHVETAKSDLAESGYRLQASSVGLYRVPGEEAYLADAPVLDAEELLRDPHEGMTPEQIEQDG